MKSMVDRMWLRAARLAGNGGTVLRRAGLALMLGALVTGSAHAAASPDKASAFVRTQASGATALLGNRALAPGDRAKKFEAMIAKNFDVRGIARYVCGAAWDSATDAQKKRFTAVFQGALARIYTDRLRDYSGETVEVTDARPDSAGVVVTTAVTGGTSRDTRSLDWNVVEVGKGMKLFDVVIDGVSTTEMTRDDYAAVLDESGGNLDALIARLSAGQR